MEARKRETPAASKSAAEVEGGGGARGTDVVEAERASMGTSLQQGDGGGGSRTGLQGNILTTPPSRIKSRPRLVSDNQRSHQQRFLSVLEVPMWTHVGEGLSILRDTASGGDAYENQEWIRRRIQ